MATNGRVGRGQLCADFCEAPAQEAAFGLCVRELQGALAVGARVVCSAEAAEQVATCRVEVLVAVERKRHPRMRLSA
jgi:hypothetical protein